MQRKKEKSKAKVPKDLTIDGKLLFKATVLDSLKKYEELNEERKQQLPADLVKLFPNYFKRKLPDQGKTGPSKSPTVGPVGKQAEPASPQTATPLPQTPPSPVPPLPVPIPESAIEPDLPKATKPADKPVETKPADKPVETKPADKPVETKPADKPVETKPADKPVETKPADKPREAIKPDLREVPSKPGKSNPALIPRQHIPDEIIEPDLPKGPPRQTPIPGIVPSDNPKETEKPRAATPVPAPTQQRTPGIATTLERPYTRKELEELKGKGVEFVEYDPVQGDISDDLKKLNMKGVAYHRGMGNPEWNEGRISKEKVVEQIRAFREPYVHLDNSELFKGKGMKYEDFKFIVNKTREMGKDIIPKNPHLNDYLERYMKENPDWKPKYVNTEDISSMSEEQISKLKKLRDSGVVVHGIDWRQNVDRNSNGQAMVERFNKEIGPLKIMKGGGNKPEYDDRGAQNLPGPGPVPVDKSFAPQKEHVIPKPAEPPKQEDPRPTTSPVLFGTVTAPPIQPQPIPEKVVEKPNPVPESTAPHKEPEAFEYGGYIQKPNAGELSVLFDDGETIDSYQPEEEDYDREIWQDEIQEKVIQNDSVPYNVPRNIYSSEQSIMSTLTHIPEMNASFKRAMMQATRFERTDEGALGEHFDMGTSTIV